MNSTARASVGRGLLTVAALLTAGLPIAVLHAAPAADLDAAGIGWLEAASAAVLLAAAGIGTVAGLVPGLRRGAAAPLLRAGTAAALAGSGLAVLMGAADVALPVLVGAAFSLAASVADRTGTTIRPSGPRLAMAAGSLVAAEASVVIGILPGVGTTVAGMATPLFLAAAALAGLGALAGAGRVSGAASGLLAIGAVALALDRGGGGDLAIGLASLGAAALVSAAAGAPRHRAEPNRAEPLPPLAQHLAEGVLVFDGRLRLTAWNAAAATLLDLGPDATGARLEDLLGLSIAQLPAASETVLGRTPVGGIDLSIHRDHEGLTVILHDPGASSDVERLGRELRGTIEELLQARRTVELQRTELERATSTDRLTGAASRTAILDRLRLEVAEARRYQHPVAAVLLDVDGFTRINTEAGVTVADDILREVALRMRVRLREADALGRLGSDAFLALLPHTEADGAATFADALRRRIAERPVPTGSAPLAVTVSVGVSVMHPGDDLDADGLLARVTEALVSAREAGGNRIALDRLHGLARLGEPAGEDGRGEGESQTG